MSLSLPQFILSMLLFAVLFFGIGFIINMLLKTTWAVAIFYPIFVILMVNKVSFFAYFTAFGSAIQQIGQRFSGLAPSDWTVLSMGLVGAILSGVTMKMLRSHGYTMF